MDCSSSGSFCRINFTLCFLLLSYLGFVILSKETLIVHKDLLSNGGLNELIFDLQREGMIICVNGHLFKNCTSVYKLYLLFDTLSWCLKNFY